ncbi:MAG: polyprenol monophosphomannose synthase [Armatimonadota bacterium]|nr:polyprenol monophosphomannose synthase [Armatimonadota bacterium]MDR5697525.1 polyprenol monophosphomannose synthase [Armatimonadota bacterium]
MTTGRTPKSEPLAVGPQLSTREGTAPTVSIIVPTYNEHDTLPELVARLQAAAGPGIEIVVVDDASPDGTAEVAEQLAREGVPVRVVRRPHKQGLATAVLAGVAASRGEILVVMDADLSHPPETVPALIATIGTGADIAVGSRYVPGGSVRDWPMRRRLMSRVAVWLARTILREPTRDPVSGFFAARRRCLAHRRLRGLGFKILVEVLAHARGARIVEVPYTFTDRRGGASKLGPAEVCNYLRLLWRLRKERGSL